MPTKDKSTTDLTAQPLAAAAAKSADPFADLDKMRLSQDFAAQAGVEKVLVRVPVRKPDKQDFIRVRPEPEYCLDAAIIEVKAHREWYFVSPEIRDQIPDLWRGYRLYTAVNRAGDVFLWPIPLPSTDGRHESWRDTSEECARLAMADWTKVVANMSMGGYQPFRAKGDLGEPQWPKDTLNELLRIAFRGMFVDNLDHPVIRRLSGLE